MKKILITCSLIISCIQSFGQNGKINGQVLDIDSKAPLEMATISIYRADSSIVAYQLSDREGKFSFEKLPLKTKLTLTVSYTGYLIQHRNFQLDTAKLGTFNVLLHVNTNKDSAVLIKAIIPITMNGDTLEINPAAFKLREEAVVEELLSQVTGITIWSDGIITVNGKKVQNLFVDGKPFMGSTDSRIATQNLPKSAIEKIQVYQEYDRTQIVQSQRTQDSLLTMNIKLKENAKKGYFGKVGFGYGTKDRFESNLSLQMYNKKSSAGMGGGFNNINKNIGNLQEMFQNDTYRNFNPNLFNVGRFANNGINKNHSFGGIYTHNFIETANSRQNNRLTINLNKSGTTGQITDLTLQNRTAIEIPQLIREEGIQNNQDSKNDLSFNYFLTKSDYDNLTVNGLLSSSIGKSNSSRLIDVKDSIGNLQSTSTSTVKLDRYSDNESLSMLFAKVNSAEPLKSFTFQMDIKRNNLKTDREVRTNFESFTDISKNALFNRRYSLRTNNTIIGGSLYYTGFKRMLLGRYDFFGIDIRLSNWFNYSTNNDHNRVSDYDSTNKLFLNNNNLTNKNDNKLIEYTPSIIVLKSFTKNSNTNSWTINLQGKLLNDIIKENNQSTISKRNIDRNFQFLRYEGNADLFYTKRQKYSYSTSILYSKNYQYPTIDQLFTIVDDINIYDLRLGNPNLQNRTNHSLNFKLSFNTQKPKSFFSINSSFNGAYTRSINPITDSIINDISSKRIFYYTNADKSSNLDMNYRFNLTRKLKKSNLQFIYNAQFRSVKIPIYIDGIYNMSEARNLVNHLTLQFSLRSVLIMNLGQNFQVFQSKQSSVRLSSFKSKNYSSNFGITLNYPTNFSFGSTVESINNTNLNKTTILWNGFATYRFMKQQFEMKFSALDLLKQYKNISNDVNAYGTSTKIQNGLQQYFLFTFSYFPRKFGKTEIKKQ